MPVSRHLGALATDYTAVTRAHGGALLQLDVNLDAPAALTADAVEALDRAIDDLARLEATARAAFAAQLADDASEPVQFWRFHRDEVEGHEALARAGFVDVLRLKRAGFYPERRGGDRGAYVVLDFIVPGPPSDQLLVASLDAAGALISVSWES